MGSGRILRRIARMLAAERGFTLIEMTVAALIMAIGLLALVSGLDHSRKLVSRSEKVETASHRAEEAIERILSLRYDRVALTTAPAHSPDPSDPRYYVTGSGYQWDQGPTGPQSETLVVDSGLGQVLPAEAWQDSESRLKGSVHQFVTLTGDRCADTVPGCPSGSQPAKRVTVAVTVDAQDALPKPVLISTLMIDPAATG